MIDLLSLYYRLPYPIKVVGASARGVQLKRWRYSKATEHLVAEALDRDTWSQAQWAIWQADRLSRVLHRAATRVPYYRDYWGKQRARGNRSSYDELQHWPVLPKAIVRENPLAFIADDRSPRDLYVDHTGGTTGTPTLIYLTRETVQHWYAMAEARMRRWHGVSYHQRWAMFGGQRVAELGRKEPPYWVHNYGLSQLYFSIFHIKRETAGDYVRALRDFAPTHMIVFPSALSVLAHHMLEQQLDPPRLTVIFSNSEKVLPAQRRAIEAAFKCPLADTYGMAEVAAAASQCTAGTMHEWPDVGVTEQYDPETQTVTDRGELAELALTSLVNLDMPLVRYLNGDIGKPPSWASCACGKTLPHLGPIQGRSNDLIETQDGRQLYLLDSLFNDLPLIEAQLVQESVTQFVVRLVPGVGYQHGEVRSEVVRILERYLGSKVTVTLEEVASIAKNKNGKFASYLSLLPRRK